jgi:mono/diheme cytochrome c family protein
MRGVVRWLLLVLVVLVVAAGVLIYSFARKGLSTRAEPSWIEERAALAMRRLATPASVREQRNPVAATPEVVEEALAHFADHCASCHANDGSGSPMGKSFYPQAPDMRAERTQRLSDGELFSIIENGIRLTGMPAWGDGTPEGQESSWGLVHFIRRLPSLPPEDIDRMQALNPKSPAEFREEEEARRFLSGEEPTQATPATPPNPNGHH